MKIHFCEQCGASVPLQEVVAGRATASDGNVYCSHHMPGSADGDLKLYFCDTCGVSIPLQDVITGTAVTEGDRTVCTDCTHRQKTGAVSNDRYQLHFCDKCNTSIPQSHVVTGRALVRGGKTYCENCRDRATRGTSPLVPVLAVLGLAAAVLAIVLVASRGPDDGPPPATKAMLEELSGDVLGRLDTMEQTDRSEDAAFDKRLREAEEEAAADVGRLDARVAEVAKGLADREALRVQVGVLRKELERLKQLEKEVARIADLEDEVARLRKELSARPTRPGPAPEPAAPEPEPEPAQPVPADIPDGVRVLIERLGSPDSGIRFSAAVDLGKAKHVAAVPSLGNLARKDEDLFVRRAAARALGEIGSRDGVPPLIDALTDAEIYVSLQAAKSLRGITGKEFGFRETLSMSQRRSVQNKWKKWWKDAEDK